MSPLLKKINVAHDRAMHSDRSWVQMINSLSGFKSANLIGTVSADGKTNVSIASSVFHLGASPPLMGFVIRPHSEKSPRHSLLNIKETKHFTINHVNTEIYKQAHQTSARYPRDTSEFEACGIAFDFKGFKAPFVKKAKIQIGLSFVSEYLIKENNTHIIVGQIDEFYFPKNCLGNDGHIDIEKALTVAVSGLDSYHKTKKLARLTYAKPDVEPQVFEP